MDAIAITDHGNMFGAVEFFSKANAARDQADHRMRGVSRAGQAHRSHPDAKGDDFDGGGNFHLILLARTRPAIATSAACSARPIRKASTTSRASTRRSSPRLQRGPDRSVRMPVRRDRACAARPNESTRRAKPPNGTRALSRIASISNCRTTPARRRSTRRCATSAAQPACRWSPPTIAIISIATTHAPTKFCSASRPARRMADEIAMALRYRRAVRQDARGDGEAFGADSEEIRNSDGDRAPGRFRVRVRQVPLPDLPRRATAAEDLDQAARHARARRPRRAARGNARAPRRHSTKRPIRTSRPRAAGHSRDGLLGLHADRRRLYRLRAQPRNSGRAGPRLGGRQPGLLRAAG